MIISASRRTDIPAFYSDWFFNRIKEGYAHVRNPMNPKQITRVAIKPDVTDCFVFWTKNPKKMLNKLHLLDDQGYNYYFHFTLTSYNTEIEQHVPPKKEIIDTFMRLSERIGKHRVIWRYDPVLLTEKISAGYHIKYFNYLAGRLKNHTEKCVISFVNIYKKCRINMKRINPVSLDDDMKFGLIKEFYKTAKTYDLILETCSERTDLFSRDINNGKCINDKLIEMICGKQLNLIKDKNQRKLCGCVASVDIGAYNTCRHGCLYCYANINKQIVKKNFLLHNPDGSLLFGDIQKDDKIYDRKTNK